jgi:hypothetical protein
VGIKVPLMRRTVAVALSAVLALFVLAPYVSLLAASSLTNPACCRRQKTDCSCCHSAQANSGQEHRFEAACGHCPSHQAIPGTNRLAFHAAAQSLLTVPVQLSRNQHSSNGVHFAAPDASHPKRGPPSFFA